ncbi:MAG: hypothetical protein ACTSSG_11300 [Candidatus Heimdallarchaeaceae archaeon]
MEYDEYLLKELKQIKDQVLFLLEHYPASRNNDFYLQVLWLKYFAGIKIPYIDWGKIGDLSGKLETVRRNRQKIQNEMCLYLPTDPEILRKRRKKEKAYRKVIKEV